MLTYLVQLFSKRRGIELSQLVGSLQTLHTGQFGFFSKAVPPGFVGLDPPVHLLQGQTGSADLGVLILSLIVKKSSGLKLRNTKNTKKYKP